MHSDWYKTTKNRTAPAWNFSFRSDKFCWLTAHTQSAVAIPHAHHKNNKFTRKMFTFTVMFSTTKEWAVEKSQPLTWKANYQKKKLRLAAKDGRKPTRTFIGWTQFHIILPRHPYPLQTFRLVTTFNFPIFFSSVLFRILKWIFFFYKHSVVVKTKKWTKYDVHTLSPLDGKMHAKIQFLLPLLFLLFAQTP